MKHGIVACLAVLLAGGFVLGQSSDSGPAPTASQAAPANANAAAPFAPEEDDTPTGGPETLVDSSSGAEPACRFWVSGEYLLWWIKNSHYPPLLTSGSATDALPGALGMPGTQVLFGGDVDNQDRSGARVALGGWLDGDGRLGVEAGYFFLGTRSVGLTSGGSGVPGSAVTARPFFNLLTNAEDASLVSYPGLASGVVSASASSELQAGEANALLGLCDGAHVRVELLAGLRYLRLDEKLGIQEDSQVSNTAAAFADDRIGVLDRFDTVNDFYGAQLGARAAFRYGRWEALLLAKVALGDVHESVTIGGSTAITTATGSTSVSPGGLLALPTNSGTFHRDEFAVVPEAGIRVDCRLTRHLHAFVGYSFLYWSEVLRPGNQIDPRLNVNEVPTSKSFGAAGGPSRPAFSFNGTDFWAQGVSFGMEFRY